MHRILASLSGLLLLTTALVFWRARDIPASARRLLYLAVLSIIVEIGLGGALVNAGLPPELATLHQAIALLIFGLVVAAGAISLRKL